MKKQHQLWKQSIMILRGAMNLNYSRKKEMIQQPHMIKMELNLISQVKINLMEIKDMKRKW
ncbi:hypothetical protein F2Q68_00008003 [Brassica cretica]|uniref:Uncharacterized protein n=1 Tax=Brassica cretica TaxID=69181 RepID=A0A8S9KR88_BRACR|nr:hypothetical protein F2Q68_00008003 [Brassica cretica]